MPDSVVVVLAAAYRLTSCVEPSGRPVWPVKSPGLAVPQLYLREQQLCGIANRLKVKSRDICRP